MSFTRLVFTKDNNTWRLKVEDGRWINSDGDEEVSSSTPLTSASRAVRLRAAEVLPSLVQNMVKSAKEQVANVEKASSKVDSFLSTVTNVLPF